MIPFASPKNFVIGIEPNNLPEQEWYIFAGEQLLIDARHNQLPTTSPLFLKNSIYMGHQEKRELYASACSLTDPAPEGWQWRPLRSLHGHLNESQLALAGRALQLVNWDLSHRFCGACGSQTNHRTHERCRECPSCGQLAYPQLAPAIMALIRKEDKILLARGPQFPHQMYSVLAGYVDPGETLEQCVRREVFEEVGLKVKNITYFNSQPWPFSRSLLMGFTCDWEEGEIVIDPTEIEDAAWFNKSHLPELPPLYSLSRLLIDHII